MNAQVALLPHLDVVKTGGFGHDAPVPLDVSMLKEPLGAIVSTGLLIGHDGIQDLTAELGVVLGQHSNGKERRSQTALHIGSASSQNTAVFDLPGIGREIPFALVSGGHHIAVAVEHHPFAPFFAEGGQNVGASRHRADNLIGNMVCVQEIADKLRHILHIAGRVFRRDANDILTKADQVLLPLIDDLPNFMLLHKNAHPFWRPKGRYNLIIAHPAPS